MKNVNGAHSRPRFFRAAKNHMFAWEIYSIRSWHITIAIRNFELTFSKWPA